MHAWRVVLIGIGCEYAYPNLAPAITFRPMPRTKPVFVLLTAALALAAGCAKPPPPPPPPPPAEVAFVLPTVKTVDKTIETTGLLRAEDNVQLRARVRGFVAIKHKQGGERVRAGDLVITIDRRPFEAAVASAKAELEQRKAQLDLAEVTLKRVSEAFKANAVSPFEVDKAKAERDASLAAVDLAAAGLRQADLDLEFTEVRSPINGRLGVNVIEQGQLVGAADATLLATVVNDAVVYATYQLNEREVLETRRENQNRRPGEDGRPNLVVLAGLMNEQGYPHVGEFARADTGVDPDTGTVTIEARFKNDDGTLLPGSFVRIRALVGEEQGMLVPDISVGADQRGRFVYVVAKNDQGQEVTRRIDVVAGPRVGDMRRLLPGEDGKLPISPTDRVVASGVQRARPEQPVKAVPEQAKDAKAQPAAGTQPAPGA